MIINITNFCKKGNNLNHTLTLNPLLGHPILADKVIGSTLWWKSIKKMGTPFIQKQDQQTCRVIFIWQDPQGDEIQSDTENVLLNVNSLTDHHSWTPACLTRISGTDVWLGELIVNIKWRGSYSFIPIMAEQLPEIARKKSNGSIEAQRQWWLDVVNNQRNDPLNPLPSLISGWGSSSALHLPGAPAELGWNEWDKGIVPEVSKHVIYPIQWISAELGNRRECFIFSTALGDAPLVVLLDGQKWGEASGTLSVLKHLTKTKKIAPAHYLLIPSLDNKTRWKELSCHYPFWFSLVCTLLPEVKIQLAKSYNTVSDYLVAGQSLGGLSALYAGIHFSDYFSKVITLSGSFWWPEVDRMKKKISLNESDESRLYTVPENSLAAQILDERVTVESLEVYQTVGLGEQDMCLYNDLTMKAIQQKGGNVYYEKVSGGHDWLSWRSCLINGLEKLLPSLY